MQGSDNEEWKDLYQNACSGLLTMTPDGGILTINNTLKDWLAIDSSERKPLNFLEFLSRGSKVYFTLFVLPILELHNTVEEISLTLSSSSGELSVLFNATKMESPVSGKIITGSVFRLNNRKKFETELITEKKEAERETLLRNQALHNIAYDHAHLFRAPLSNILGLIDMLQNEIEETMRIEVVAKLKESAQALDAATRSIIQQSTTKGL